MQMREMYTNTRTQIDVGRPNCRKLTFGARWSAGSQRARHASARTRRCEEQGAPDWRSRCDMTSDPTQLRFVQPHQILHLFALAIDVLVKTVPRPRARGGRSGYRLPAHAGRPCDRLQRAFKPSPDFARSVPPSEGRGQVEDAEGRCYQTHFGWHIVEQRDRLARQPCETSAYCTSLLRLSSTPRSFALHATKAWKHVSHPFGFSNACAHWRHEPMHCLDLPRLRSMHFRRSPSSIGAVGKYLSQTDAT